MVLRHTDKTKDSRKVFGWIQLLGSRRVRQSDVVVVNQESYGAHAFISSQLQLGFLVSQRLSRTSTHEFIERWPCNSTCDPDAPNKQLYKQQSDSQIPILSPTSFAQRWATKAFGLAYYTLARRTTATMETPIRTRIELSNPAKTGPRHLPRECRMMF